MQDFIHWLFNDPNGHFAILCFMLAACAIAWLFHVPQADIAAATLFTIVLAKLK
ncbi:MAG TPA: hypothetical protein VGM97_01965 [Steroidobacteraceae bacterium]|jgi:hypothetical protein